MKRGAVVDWLGNNWFSRAVHAPGIGYREVITLVPSGRFL